MRPTSLLSLIKAVENYPLYSQDGKGMDAKVVAVIAYVQSSMRHYILEGSREGSDITLFGITTGLYEPEYGYMSLKEINGIRGSICTVLKGERTLADIAHKDSELESFLNRLYNK